MNIDAKILNKILAIRIQQHYIYIHSLNQFSKLYCMNKFYKHMPHIQFFFMFPKCVCVCVCMCAQSVKSDSLRPHAVFCQAPTSMEFSRQEYWSELPFPTPGDLLNSEM